MAAESLAEEGLLRHYQSILESLKPKETFPFPFRNQFMTKEQLLAISRLESRLNARTF